MPARPSSGRKKSRLVSSSQTQPRCFRKRAAPPSRGLAQAGACALRPAAVPLRRRRWTSTAAAPRAGAVPCTASRGAGGRATRARGRRRGRAGEGEGRGESFAGGAGAGGDYGAAPAGRTIVKVPQQPRRVPPVPGRTRKSLRAAALRQVNYIAVRWVPRRARGWAAGRRRRPGSDYGGTANIRLVCSRWAPRHARGGADRGRVAGALSANGGDGGKAVAALTARRRRLGGAPTARTPSPASRFLRFGPAARCWRTIGLRGGRRRARRRPRRAGTHRASPSAGGRGGAGAGSTPALEWARDGASGANAPPRRWCTACAGKDLLVLRPSCARPSARSRQPLDRPVDAASPCKVTTDGELGAASGARRTPCESRRASAVPPRDVQGGRGQRRQSPCAPIPRRAVFVDPAPRRRRRRRRRRAPVRTKRSGGEAPGVSACATRAEAAVARGGRPAARGRGAAAVVLCAASSPPSSARARGGAPRARRGGGRRAPQRFGSGFLPRVASRARPAFASASAASGLATPFPRATSAMWRDFAASRRERPGSTADGDAGGEAARASRWRVSRPWCTSPGANVVRPVAAAAHAPRCNRCCTRRNGPRASRARVRDGRARELGRGPAKLAPRSVPRDPRVPEPGDPDGTRRPAFGGSAARRGRDGAARWTRSSACCSPGQTWWRERESPPGRGVPCIAAGRLRPPVPPCRRARAR